VISNLSSTASAASNSFIVQLYQRNIAKRLDHNLSPQVPRSRTQNLFLLVDGQPVQYTPADFECSTVPVCARVNLPKLLAK
jgi:hypothetical protein